MELVVVEKSLHQNRSYFKYFERSNESSDRRIYTAIVNYCIKIIVHLCFYNTLFESAYVFSSDRRIYTAIVNYCVKIIVHLCF